MSRDQQTRLIEWGNLPLGYQPEGGPDACQNGAEVQIETQTDAAPGPRFYCRECAIDFLRLVALDAEKGIDVPPPAA